MKPPMYALLISPSWLERQDILAGVKTVTVREGHRDYRPGLVMLCCHLVLWAVKAEITEVRHCTLREVTAEEWKANGFEADKFSSQRAAQRALLEGMQRWYPNLTWDSPVTVVRWKNVEGFLTKPRSRLLYRREPEQLYSEIQHRPH